MSGVALLEADGVGVVGQGAVVACWEVRLGGDAVVVVVGAVVGNKKTVDDKETQLDVQSRIQSRQAPH